MSRSLIAGLVLMAGACALAWLPLAAAPARPVGPVPKTIILGFDGMDHELTRRFMEAGDLPNFKRLAEQGLYQRLETTNPAQSPVSWAVFNTGCNPGKTGVAGFVSRMFVRGKDGEVQREQKFDEQGRITFNPVPLPRPMLGDAAEVDARDFVAFPMALDNRAGFVLLAAGAGLVAALLLFKLLLRLATPLALVIALGAGAGGYLLAARYADGLPADGKLPYTINPMQGTFFWKYLDEQGIRLRGVQVASTYPPDHEGENTELLAGLGVPDITGSPGSWTVYTTDEWLYYDKGTQTAGLVRKLFEDTPGVLEDDLLGPRNWLAAAALDTRREALKGLRDDPGLSTAEIERLDAQLEELGAESRRLSARGKHNDRAKVRFRMHLDKAARAIEFEVAGRRFRVPQGGWSEMIPVEFVLGPGWSAKGLATFHVVRCDDEEVRVFVPPINIDPSAPPPQLPISSPPDFAALLQERIGHPYETLGWACITNPLKDFEDSKLPEQSFLDDMVSTEALREDLLRANLAHPDEWDVYFQVFSTPDRACHMLMRETDRQHPLHDPALAATQVTAYGRTFPLSDAIRQVYMNEDRLLGGVLDQLQAGHFGDDALLLIVSDHGFTSFRREVNLNNVLADFGYLVLIRKPGDDGQLSDVRWTVPELMEAGPAARDMLSYVDWSQTRAYSLGLGEVFVNLVGREPLGIVRPEDYDATVEAIRRDLLALKDPQGGASVVSSASRRDELYSGPWWKEGRAPRKEALGRVREVSHDGFADIFLGYAPYYRVSWANTMGGLDESAITDNDNHWSGDHVSVDPGHVPGVLFSNRKLPAGTVAGLIDIAPTVLERYGLAWKAPATEMDGKSLPFENLTR
jgi:predicted AlkP superfamily phosphohydrolase/phosphomutase